MTLYSATGNCFALYETISSSPDLTAWSRHVHAHPTLDGILILWRPSLAATAWQLFVINRDGSHGQFSGNGLCIAADHLFRTDPQFTGELFMANQRIVASRDASHHITLHLCAQGQWLGIARRTLPHGLCTGYRVELGNPHWVIFSSITPQELTERGKNYVEAFLPETRVNVEFVWRDACDRWHMIPYERGVGRTASSGSGAMATVRTLVELGQIPINTWVDLTMPGGTLSLLYSSDGYQLRRPSNAVS